jgi:hypothetical protein
MKRWKATSPEEIRYNKADKPQSYIGYPQANELLTALLTTSKFSSYFFRKYKDIPPFY